MLPSKELCFLPHPVPRGNGFLLKQTTGVVGESCLWIQHLPTVCLDIKTEVHDIAIFDKIFLAFKSHQTFFLGTCFTF